jgi:hypothetical protein
MTSETMLYLLVFISLLVPVISIDWVDKARLISYTVYSTLRVKAKPWHVM